MKELQPLKWTVTENGILYQYFSDSNAIHIKDISFDNHKGLICVHYLDKDGEHVVQIASSIIGALIQGKIK